MCPICSDIRFEQIGRPRIGPKAQQFIRKDYKVVKCTNCSFYYVQPDIDLSKSEWQKLYDLEYFEPMTKSYSRKRENDRKKRFDKLNKYSSNSIRRFLDVGCGEGYSLIEAVNRGWETYGIDITDHRIEESKNNNINFRNADLISANFPENFFDCIYVDSVLEHVQNPMEVLHELNRITAKGGVIYIGVPNEDALFNRVLQGIFTFTGRFGESAKIKPFATPFHIVGFTNQSLQYAIKSSGCSVMEFRNFASKADFMKTKVFSRGFLIAAFYFPIALLAVPLRMEVYYEVYLLKN